MGEVGALQLLPKDSEFSDSEDLQNLPEDEAERIQFLKEKGAVRFDEMYNMVAVLGVGGFGVVVACKNKHNNRKYALKIVQYDADHPTQDALSLIREQKLLQTIKHPNIIKVYPPKQRYHNYIVMKMELAEESLSQFIGKYEERHGTRAIPEETCAKIMLGLFRALQHLHDNVNMIHRDVKLENIVIGSHNNYAKVKLIDFGLAVQSE